MRFTGRAPVSYNALGATGADVKKATCLGLGVLLGSACATAPVAAPPPPKPSGLDFSILDRTVSPCSDFYQFACGTWMAKTEIPADRPIWVRSFSVVKERNDQEIHDLLDGLADGGGSTSAPWVKQVSDYYAACMDEAGVEGQGLQPLQPELDRIASVSDAASLEREVAHLHAAGIFPFFGFGSTQDYKDASSVIAEVAQGGLGLPDRDYYVKDDERSKNIQALYVEHVAHMLQLTGLTEADAHAQAAGVMRLETQLAQASWTRTERRQPTNVYHRLELEGLTKAAPHFAWSAYLADLGYPTVTAINVTAPQFVAKLSEVLATTKPADWKAYLRWQLVHAVAPYLPKAFVDEDFHFTSTALTDTKQILPRWKRCVASVDQVLGFSLGRLFVEKYFAESQRERARTDLASIEQSFAQNLDALPWMDAVTKGRAHEKLGQVDNKVGYPTKWRDYSSVHIAPGAYLADTLAGHAFDVRYDLDKVGKPLDRTEWHMTPHTVNAYYNGSMNEMVFPAGIFQPPFYSADAADWVNLGGIGMVMGHELTHGFDDKGRQFDGKGNLADWWTPDSTKTYTEKAECVAKQFDGFTVDGDAHVNGHLTLGEDIADLGGLKMAYEAMRRSLPSDPAPFAKEELTPEQEFFVGFAQVWCANARPKFQRNMTTVDTHAPPRFRVNGPLSNFAPFAAAFSCPAGSPMVRPPEQRCEVW